MNHEDKRTEQSPLVADTPRFGSVEAKLDLRQQAEKLFRERMACSPEDLKALSLEEAQLLLHELQVHQIELEIQNEELWRVQVELDAAREIYFELYDLAPVGYVVVNNLGLILNANFAAATLLGCSPGSLAKQPFFRFIFKADQDVYFLLRKQLLFFERNSQACELRMVKRDETVIWVQLSTTVVQDKDDAPVYRIALIDITERKRAEIVLHRKQFMLARTEKIAQIGSWEWDVATDTVTWSDELFRIFQLEPAEPAPSLTEQSELYHPEDMERLKSAVEASVNKGTPYELELRAYRKDGTTRVCLARGQAEVAQGGRVTRLAGTLQDITERKRAEEALRASEERLREAQKMANVGNWEFDIATNKIWASDRAFEIFGLDPSTENTMEIAEVEACIRDREKVHQALVDLIEKDTPYNIEIEVHPANGFPPQFVHSIAKCTRTIEGFPKKVIGILQNITERKQAENEKLNLEARLSQAQKMEAIGTLAGGIAHDFNNILGAIIGYTEIARHDAPPDSPIANRLEKVLGAGQRAATLVKQILAFSRQANIERIPLIPSHIVKEAIKLLRPSMPSTIEIKQQIDTSTRPILADPTQVHQIIMNLCTNAYHAMEQTGGVLHITIEDCELSLGDLQKHPEVQPGGFVMLSIGDTGAGIDPVIRSKIFDPYFTTKEVGKGTGMGLSIVHGIVASYGGFVTCESEIGKGTVFNIFFPAIEVPVVSEVKPMAVTPSGTERILFIDDEEMLAELGKEMLEQLGYDVTISTCSLGAWSTFQSQPNHFDVVVTDQTMPGMTGMELSRRMLQIRPDIPIIICTGHSTLINKKQVLAEGVKGFTMKPLDKEGLATLLRKVLDESKMEG